MSALALRPHGVPGQLNAYVLDVDSDVTGYGQHNRLVVWGPASDGSEPRTITIREDLRGLPLSTDAQRRKVARGWQRMHPRGTRLTFVQTGEPWEQPGFGTAIEHTYTWSPA